jgi:hypothetical protein
MASSTPPKKVLQPSVEDQFPQTKPGIPQRTSQSPKGRHTASQEKVSAHTPPQPATPTMETNMFATLVAELWQWIMVCWYRACTTGARPRNPSLPLSFTATGAWPSLGPVHRRTASLPTTSGGLVQAS